MKGRSLDPNRDVVALLASCLNLSLILVFVLQQRRGRCPFPLVLVSRLGREHTECGQCALDVCTSIFAHDFTLKAWSETHFGVGVLLWLGGSDW